MSAQTAYDRLLPIILGLSNEKQQRPYMAVEDKIAEVGKVLKLIPNDKDALINAGLDAQYIDTLEDRMGAYSISEANYIVLKNGNGELKKKLKSLDAKAHALRKTIVHALKFVLQDNEEAQKTLKHISKGRSRNDMAYDFMPLKKLAITFSEDLDRIHFDKSLLDDADQVSEDLLDVLAQIAATPKKVSEVKAIRNKAYTYLNEALTKIKAHAKFVFWEDEERLALYKNDTMKKRKHSSQNKENTSTLQESTINE